MGSLLCVICGMRARSPREKVFRRREPAEAGSKGAGEGMAKILKSLGLT